jgi:hypothetical protein
MKQAVSMRAARSHATIAGDAKPAPKAMPMKPQPVFGLGKDQCPPVPWSAFAPMADDAADWDL